MGKNKIFSRDVAGKIVSTYTNVHSIYGTYLYIYKHIDMEILLEIDSSQKVLSVTCDELVYSETS